MNAWIGLGGNDERSVTLINLALSLLEEHGEVSVLRRSRMYRSPPWGITEQAEFSNCVAELETSLQADELLDLMLDIEIRLGRERTGPRWGPRCIDLDLLTYQDLVLKSVKLELPHPRMHLRAFVLVPIMELDPEFLIPGVGQARYELEKLGRRELESVRPMEKTKPEIYV